MDPTQDKEANKGSRGRRNNRDGKGIYYANSENRMEITQVKIKDALERLKDITIIAAKEIRQKMITENREKRIENRRQQRGKNISEIKQQATSRNAEWPNESFKKFEENKRNELENIMIIVDHK